MKYMNNVIDLYKHYPNSVDSFKDWREKETSLFEEIYSKFIRTNLS